MSETESSNQNSDAPAAAKKCGDNKPAKTSWPELVGMTAEEAEKIIKEEMDGAYTPVVPENGIVTFDFRTNRVRLFVDDAGKVVRAPSIG